MREFYRASFRAFEAGEPLEPLQALVDRFLAYLPNLVAGSVLALALLPARRADD